MNNKICKSCGCKLDAQYNKDICENCIEEFVKLDREFKECEDSKYLKYCRYCGRPFLAIRSVIYTKTGTVAKRATKREYCDHHYAMCKWCGSPILFGMNSDSWRIPVACSKECRKKIQVKHTKETFQEKYGVDSAMQCQEFVEKYKRNCLEKYGVDNTFKLDSVKDKVKKTSIEKYGVDHPAKSSVVQEKMRAAILEKYGTLSVTSLPEVKERIRKTNLERYGSDNPMRSEQVKSKLRKTCLEKYGTEYAIQSHEVQNKIRAKLLDKYGSLSSFHSQEVLDKRKQTWINKYGVDHPMKVLNIHEKALNTSMERYGGVGNGSDILLRKFKETCESKYGVGGIWHNTEVNDRKKQTFLGRYGVDHPMKSTEVKNKVRWARIMSHAATIQDSKARKNYIEFNLDPRNYILTHFNHKPSLIEISETIGNLDCTSVSARIPSEFHDLLGTYQTSIERHVCDYIKSIDSNIRIIVHDKHIIKPYELDIYLPDYNMAIECDPTATHNSSIHIFSKEDKPLDKNYHRMKTDLCEKQGIFLFHIFGYEWSNRSQVIQSMIRNLLQKNKTKYYARNLVTADVSYEDSVKFLSDNHLQGKLNSPVRLGLFTRDNLLVSLMTFNRQRNTLGIKLDSTVDSWELSRFCNIKGCSVIGGASKLFKYFIDKYSPNEVISFSDRAHTVGNIYEKLGFKQSTVSSPSYVWVNMNSDGYLSRVSCQKRNIRRTLHDPCIDIDNKTEQQIMMEHGYVQFYDCGKIRWEWHNNVEALNNEK